jgi:hypothetical protein
MNHRVILIAALVGLAATVLQAHKHPAQSATSTMGWPPAPTATFVASSEKTFDQLMADAMNVMHKGMHS